MGLFDDLKKLSKDVVDGLQTISKDVASEVSKMEEVRRTEVEKAKTIPEAYGSFPKFSKECTHLDEKKTDKYQRCTMDYRGVTKQEVEDYQNSIKNEGYVQNTTVRFDKDNTYIIVDYSEAGQDLNLVFHIKK